MGRDYTIPEQRFLEGFMTDRDDFWVFGYGSLMWRPGFDFEEAVTATVYGYHRALCAKSYAYRGTKEVPGLVMGLQRGGCCRGRAFRVAPEKKDETVRYLQERELISDFYDEKFLMARTEKGPVTVYTFVADPDHEQYAGHLSAEDAVAYVLQGEGKMGRALDYLRNTIQHLDELGIPDGPLHGLLKMAEAEEAKRKGGK